MITTARRTALAAALTLAATAHAAIVGIAGGTAAPAATLGGYAMTAFGNDARVNGLPETGVASPLGGTVGFSPALTHAEIGDGWATWSHGYAGDLYYTPGPSLTLTLPAGTAAFYLYAEPDDFNTFTVTGSSGAAVVVQAVAGLNGASYFGFYGTGGDTVSSITVAMNPTGYFAIGEFGIAKAAGVPDTGATLALFGIALVAAGAMRRRIG